MQEPPQAHARSVRHYWAATEGRPCSWKSVSALTSSQSSDSFQTSWSSCTRHTDLPAQPDESVHAHETTRQCMYIVQNKPSCIRLMGMLLEGGRSQGRGDKEPRHRGILNLRCLSSSSRCCFFAPQNMFMLVMLESDLYDGGKLTFTHPLINAPTGGTLQPLVYGSPASHSDKT
jgi:hypothetical protein